jgi:hypothetical protein
MKTTHLPIMYKYIACSQNNTTTLKIHVYRTKLADKNFYPPLNRTYRYNKVFSLTLAL